LTLGGLANIMWQLWDGPSMAGTGWRSACVRTATTTSGPSRRTRPPGG